MLAYFPQISSGAFRVWQSYIPLGIVSSNTYEDIQFHLPHGSRLTFYSDGSTQRAASIAEAAMRFGQSDDITVVTIEHCAL